MVWLMKDYHLVNSNIRCIEISIVLGSYNQWMRVNSNIRCIEIYLGSTIDCRGTMVNSNIRCIEMQVFQAGVQLGMW